MRWAARKWWNPFAVAPLMSQARRHGHLSIEAAAAAVEQPSDEEMAAVTAAVDAWVAQRVAEGRPPARLGLLWFLLFKCNRGRAVQLTLLSVAFMAFRIFSSFMFTTLMAVLADSTADLVLLPSLPPPGAAVVVYAIVALCASFFNFLMDQSAKHLGTRIRMNLTWCVQAATLRTTVAATSTFSSSAAVGLASIDAMNANWAVCSLPYAIVVPVEIVVMIMLSISVVGLVAAGCAMIPLAIFLILKGVVMAIVSKKQAAARGIQSKRLNVLSEAIDSNAVVKLMGTAEETLDNMAALRRKEERLWGWVSLSDAYSLFIVSTLAVQMSWVSMHVRGHREDLFTASSIMTVLAFYRTIATYDMYNITTSIQSLTLAANSLMRHYAYFESTARAGSRSSEDGNAKRADCGGGKVAEVSPVEKRDTDGPLVELKDAAFSWSPESHPTLAGLTFTLPRNKLIGVAGHIGSGKSTLLLALLGELQRCEGSAAWHPDWSHPVAYMPQQHWLQTGTLRDNVCYAFPESSDDPGWAESVANACGMARDLQEFPEGLDHFIGEAGSSLSGGQQARVSLSRAVHAAASITVLDDPLCALDPGLAAEVFRRTMGPGGMLRGPGRSVILVTTDPIILAQCDVVAVVRDGTVTAVAPPAELGPDVLEFEIHMKGSTNGGEEGASNVAPATASTKPLRQQDPVDVACGDGDTEGGDKLKDGTDDDAAASEHGYEDAELLKGVDVKLRSSLRACMVFLGWAAALGGLLLIASQGLVIFWSVTVQKSLDLTHIESEFRNLDRLSRGLLAPITISAGAGVGLHFWSFLAGSTAMQARSAAAVLASPYSFFSINPGSKIFSTISADAQIVEQTLSVSMGAMWSVTAQLVGTVVLSVISLWYLIFLFLPLAATYVWVQRIYAASVTPFVRADAAARNPVCHVISSIFEGQAVVRAFQRQDIVRKDTSHVIACLRGTSLAMVNATGWLICITSVFIFNCINVVVAVSLVLALTPGPESLGPTVMSNISSLSSILTGVAIIVSSVQISSSAVQRLCLFSELPTEEDAVRHPTRDLIVQAAAAVKEAGGPDPDDSEMLLITEVEEEPPEGWPSTGSVAFRHAFAAYVWGTAPALKDVTIDIPAGSSCSIVGRSGSGKSTAFLALTGIIPVVSGAVEIDGLDVGHVPLRTLRAALAVVPQHPVLFSGSLRLNLDPHGQHGDSALWEALRAVGLIDAVTAVGGLGADPLAAGMSQGQRQLLCLARALLRDCSLLLLDEANASVDAATEQQMAVTVAAFGAGEISVVAGGAPHRRTIIEVAHRLKGCLAMDQVVVLGAGRVLEAGVPRELSKKAGGEFAGMLSAQGIEI